MEINDTDYVFPPASDTMHFYSNCSRQSEVEVNITLDRVYHIPYSAAKIKDKNYTFEPYSVDTSRGPTGVLLYKVHYNVSRQVPVLHGEYNITVFCSVSHSIVILNYF